MMCYLNGINAIIIEWLKNSCHSEVGYEKIKTAEKLLKENGFQMLYHDIPLLKNAKSSRNYLSALGV